MPTAPLSRMRAQLRRAGRVAAQFTGLAVVASLCLGVLAAVSAPAGATTSHSATYVAGHDPFGSVSSVKATATGLVVSGWAADPDARTSRVSLLGIVDGHTHAGATTTNLPNAGATKKYKLGATPGFSFTIPVPAGNHTACIVVVNVGKGLRKVLKCVATPLGRRLTARQVAARSPRGVFAAMSATSNSLHVTGTAYDPDYIYRRTVIVLYVDRRVAASVYTLAKSAFDISVKVGRGTHVGCVWAVNFGWGSNKFLGCRAADTRGAAGTGAVTQPALNKKVLAEAKKHIGQPYVWGATGPKKFDCSGLVMYSYKKFGYRTPRVSEDQFLAARLIPQSRAVPGDLVFYSDGEGDIYHVGIYSGPNMSVAAIDTQEGVNWQRIYPSNTTFFGSFTHH